VSNLSAIRRIAAASSQTAGRRGTRFRIEALKWDGIREPPADLARSAGVTLDVYALARLTRSENATDGPAYALAVCEAGRNEAARRARLSSTPRETRSPAGNLLFRTSGTFDRTRGHFGRQRGRWAATLLDPRVKDVVAAQECLKGTTLAKGATKFFSPKAQDGGTQGGIALRRDAMGVIQEWGSDGNVWVGDLPGIDPYKLMLFTNVGRPANSREMSLMRNVVERGRGGTSREFPLTGGSMDVAGNGAIPDLKVRGVSDGDSATRVAALAGGAFIIL
jgi:hypothetical protein